MNPKRLVPALVLAAALAGCAKPVAPVAPRNANVDPGAGAIDAATTASGRAFQVRLVFEGSIVTLDAAFQPHVEQHRRFYVYGTGATLPYPADTVPARSVLRRVEWKPVRGADSASTGDALVSEAPAIVGEASRDTTHVFAPGVQVITLQAPPRAGGGRVQVAFVVDFDPVAWWAGPDPALWPRSRDGDGRAVDVTDWATFTTSPPWPADGRGYFGPDSFRWVPSQRRPVANDFDRRTFYEIAGDRIYARDEGDTVHVNSWIVVVHGGYDRDSPYAPHVVAGDPGLPPDYASDPLRYAVLVPQGLIGSPVAFRNTFIVRRPDGTMLRASQTTPYPVFDPASVFRYPRVAGYVRADYPGKVYLSALAEDAEGRHPYLLAPDPVELADLVDAGGGTPQERLLRRQVLTFHVRPPAPDRAPTASDPGETSRGTGRAR